MVKKFTFIEKDEYLLIDNPDSINDYKIMNLSTIIGSSEVALYFGELQIHEVLRIDGEVNVFKGSPYVNVLNHDIFFDETLIGEVTINDEVFINAELTII